MKSIDARKKRAVTLTFLIDDQDIAPQRLAQEIASACGGGILEPGDAIRFDPGKIACVITDETLSLPSFGWEWRRSMTTPRRSRKLPRRSTARPRKRPRRRSP